MPRSSVTELVSALQGGAPLRDALVDALGDPSLDLVYRLDPGRGIGGTGWVDAEGRGTPQPSSTPTRPVEVITRNGEPLAALIYDSAKVGDPSLVRAVTTAAGLALHNERLQAELRAEVRLTGTIADTAPSLLSNVDVDGRIVKLNPAMLRASGFTADEDVQGRFFWDVFIDPGEREVMKARFAAAAPDFPPSEYENTFTNVRGERLVIYWRSSPVLDDHGRVASIVAAGLDITERGRLEAEKERERAFLNAIANNAPSLLCLIDEAGRVTDGGANMAFELTLEHPPESIGGDVFWERYVVAEESDEVRRSILQVVAGEEPVEHDNRWRTSSGRHLHVAWSCTPLPGVDERTLFLVSGSDVTERKQRELEAELRGDFLDAITRAIPSFLLAVDPEGVIMDDGVNAAFTHAFGWQREEIGGRSFLDVIAPADRDEGRTTIAGAWKGVEQEERESWWLRRDGEPRVVAWTARPVLDPQGRDIVLVSGSDVTVRRKQDEDLRASRARIVDAADDARRKLERNLHDGAQQRLVALSISLRLAESKLRADPDAAAAILAGAREELVHALDELRELARGIHPAVLTDRGLGAAVDALVARSPVPVEAAIPRHSLPAAVEAAIYYVVAEALANIAKHGQASSAQVNVWANDGIVTVTVADDGVGGADPEQGSGLKGLSDRVAALGGTLAVDSPPGAGTRVTAVLPVRAEDHEDQPPAPT